MIQRVTFCWISQFIGVAKSLSTDPDVYQASYCYIIWEIFRSNSSLSSVCGLGTRISPLVTHCICKWMSSFYPPKYIYIYYIYTSEPSQQSRYIKIQYILRLLFFPSKHFGIPETQICWLANATISCLGLQRWSHSCGSPDGYPVGLIPKSVDRWRSNRIHVCCIW